MDFWSHLTQLLLQPPGSLAYHLVLTFALIGALQGAFFHWQATRYPQGARLMLGLGGLLGLRVLLFLVQALAWQGVLEPTWLPALERLANVGGMVLLFWLWAFPEPSSKADVATSLLLLFLVALALFTWVMLTPDNLRWFHGSWLDRLWSGLGLVLALAGVGVLAWRRPEGSLYGGLTLLALAAGHLVHLLLIEPGATASMALRLGELAAYPFVFSLLYRYPLPAASPKGERPVPAAEAPYLMTPSPDGEVALTTPAPTQPPSAAALEALVQALRSLDPEERSERLAQAAAQYLVADLCLLMSPPFTSGLMDVVAGYDLIREQALPGHTLAVDQVPLVASASEKGKTLRLPASSTSSDLRTIARWLGLESSGPLLAVPLVARSDTPALGTLVFLSPFAQRPWTHEDEQRAKRFAQAAARVLLASVSDQSAQVGELEAEVEQLRQRLAETQTRLDKALSQREELEERLASAQDHLESLAALMDDLETLQQEVNRLEDENRELKEQLLTLNYFPEALEGEAGELSGEPTVSPTPPEDEQLRQSLRMALEEVALLKSELAFRDQQMLELERRNAVPQQALLYSSLISLVQDVRQHLSTIVGYTDLLLSESAGLLGKLQREFLERIRHAAEKVTKIVEDAANLASMDVEGQSTLEMEPVQLSEVLDAAIVEHGSLLREKRLTLRVDLPDTLPTLKVNRDALQQIVNHLLHNAALASPEEGDIFLRVEERFLPEGRFIQLAVQDSGPGIAEEDLPRVFSRIYRTGYRTIEGLGDNGVGLPLVKTLVEALGGRVWVESRLGEGATFEVLLPLEPESAPAPEETPAEQAAPYAKESPASEPAQGRGDEEAEG